VVFVGMGGGRVFSAGRRILRRPLLESFAKSHETSAHLDVSPRQGFETPRELSEMLLLGSSGMRTSQGGPLTRLVGGVPGAEAALEGGQLPIALPEKGAARKRFGENIVAERDLALSLLMSLKETRTTLLPRKTIKNDGMDPSLKPLLKKQGPLKILLGGERLHSR